MTFTGQNEKERVTGRAHRFAYDTEWKEKNAFETVEIPSQIDFLKQKIVERK